MSLFPKLRPCVGRRIEFSATIGAVGIIDNHEAGNFQRKNELRTELLFVRAGTHGSYIAQHVWVDLHQHTHEVWRGQRICAVGRIVSYHGDRIGLREVERVEVLRRSML